MALVSHYVDMVAYVTGMRIQSILSGAQSLLNLSCYNSFSILVSLSV
jgi:hypothetical protein